MSKVIYLPLEPLHERYTEQMKRWVEADLVATGTDYTTVEGDPTSDSIQNGQWLDITSTIAYKASQIRKLAKLFEDGVIVKGDWILLGDVWFPGIESIKYMADLMLGKDSIKFAGWHYAGCYDKHDFLAKGLGEWGKRWERHAIRNILDLVVVGSHFHKKYLVEGVGEDVASKILPYGLAWDHTELLPYHSMIKKKIVVFPHRNAPEKQPHLFRMAAQHFWRHHPEWKFVISTSGQADIAESQNVSVVKHTSKDSYYKFLAECSIFYSSALQETFGYALHEAIVLGLSIVAPNRCSYPETLQDDSRFLYNDKDVIGINLLEQQINSRPIVPLEYSSRYSGSTKWLLNRMKEKA